MRSQYFTLHICCFFLSLRLHWCQDQWTFPLPPTLYLLLSFTLSISPCCTCAASHFAPRTRGSELADDRERSVGLVGPGDVPGSLLPHLGSNVLFMATPKERRGRTTRAIQLASRRLKPLYDRRIKRKAYRSTGSRVVCSWLVCSRLFVGSSDRSTSSSPIGRLLAYSVTQSPVQSTARYGNCKDVNRLCSSPFFSPRPFTVCSSHVYSARKRASVQL